MSKQWITFRRDFGGGPVISTFAAVLSFILFRHAGHSEDPLSAVRPDAVPAPVFDFTTVALPDNVPRGVIQFTHQGECAVQLHRGSFQRDHELQS